MHTILPYEGWLVFYDASEDERSPFYGKQYDFSHYNQAIYNYYIDPAWDFFGSETLYMKLLYCNYHEQLAIIELMGEWNDTLYNDIMHLKRNIIDRLLRQGIRFFILIGENVLNFHGSDDAYYEEWFDDLDEGWICALNFRPHVYQEWEKYDIDYYIHYGESLNMLAWRTLEPLQLFEAVKNILNRRIALS
ncbi:hypothetical protein [Thermonema rossianum]|uniref:hypothetical protein n=1 Tax=Thermonema rossianum TaxID=55505 RepID=UPI000571B384|nr:hypothetical protein [Thermonema rossianum]